VSTILTQYRRHVPQNASDTSTTSPSTRNMNRFQDDLTKTMKVKMIALQAIRKILVIVPSLTYMYFGYITFVQIWIATIVHMVFYGKKVVLLHL
jgi:hypothetical protein